MSDPSAHAGSKGGLLGRDAGRLAALQGRSLRVGRLLVLLGPKNSVGARYFLRLPDGGLSSAFLLGLRRLGEHRTLA
jgi:hypothetical protein